MPKDELTKCQPDARGACHWAHLDHRANINYNMLDCDRFFMGDKYCDWHDLLGKLILKNFGTADLFPRAEAEKAYDEISEKMLYARVSVDQARVLLTSSYTSRNRYYADMTPLSAETFGGVHLYEANNMGELRMYYQKTMRYEGTGFSWTFGTIMNNKSFTCYNLWWIRIAYQPHALLQLEEHSETLSGSDKKVSFQDLVPDYDKFGKATGSIGLQYRVYRGRYYHRKESGTDFRGFAKEDKFDVGEIDHARLYGFDYYVIQATTGLAECAT